MLIRIEAPHFVAGFDTETKHIAPIIAYMQEWTLTAVILYCEKKNWELQII